jgi:hypothetical protein
MVYIFSDAVNVPARLSSQDGNVACERYIWKDLEEVDSNLIEIMLELAWKD